jgi:alkanesulfonate monooxygenase SsuD/methylene tetrahydromethanopterin reductase-like flavin-dependent oxidoreductase (luciferase family)
MSATAAGASAQKKGREMADRLGLGIIPGVGWRAAEIKTIAREAEDAGFEAIVTTEVNNDSLATAQLMGESTSRIRVGTWVSSIHMRHSYACAKAASLIADATGGQMLLGLGVSHQPVNVALGVDMSSPAAALRRYATEVRSWLCGEGPATHLPQAPAPVPVPIYLAAMTLPTVELAGELADGVMPFMWSPARITQSKVLITRGRAKAPDRGPLDIALGIPTFVGTDVEARRDAARANLALFTTFPFYQRMFRASGFSDEATKAEQGAGGASYSDRMLDAICLIGPISRCRNQLAEFRAAGVDFPILSPPVGVEGASELIKAFRQ